jgi:hypothetical protein
MAVGADLGEQVSTSGYQAVRAARLTLQHA